MDVLDQETNTGKTVRRAWSRWSRAREGNNPIATSGSATHPTVWRQMRSGARGVNVRRGKVIGFKISVKGLPFRTTTMQPTHKRKPLGFLS